MDGPVDADVFRAYVTLAPVPRLRPGDVGVLDDLAARRAAGVAEAVGAAAGATALCLPPYSPDLDPIEDMWSEVKGRRRPAAARTLDAPGGAIDAAAPAAVTRDGCRGFFRNCGYVAT